MACRTLVYYSVLVPYVPAAFRTEWHPTEPKGSFSVLTRGAFQTIGEAIDWARTHLNGAPWELRKVVPEECAGYETDERDRITSPGKFECQPLYVPFYWAQGLDGCAFSDDGEAFTFELTEDDRAAWPDLAGVKTLRLRESELGFVYLSTEGEDS